MRQRVGLGTREESRDELLLWEEKRMMGGLCQQAWEGEEDRDEGGVFIEWGVWDEQNCRLCNCYVWVFNEPLSSCSLATELLLLAREMQHKHARTNTHTQKTSFALQKLLKLSPIKQHTQHIHFSTKPQV